MSDPQFDAFKAAVHDRYVIESEIGRGGRGTVYRARETESSSTVALKVFHSDLASALDFTRFLKEMRKAARVRHPGIVPTLTVDEAALITALQRGTIRGAGLDVFDPEPPAADHPLFSLPNTVCTTHIGSYTSAGVLKMHVQVAQQVAMALRGERPTNLVNADVWGRQRK